MPCLRRTFNVVHLHASTGVAGLCRRMARVSIASVRGVHGTVIAAAADIRRRWASTTAVARRGPALAAWYGASTDGAAPTCRLVVGVDEAGRGPVLGPL